MDPIPNLIKMVWSDQVAKLVVMTLSLVKLLNQNLMSIRMERESLLKKCLKIALSP